MKYLVMALLCLTLGCLRQQKKEEALVDCGAVITSEGVTKRCSPQLPPGQEFSGFICSRVANCYDIEVDECQASVYEQQGLSQHSILNVESFKNLDDMYTKGLVQSDWGEWISCFTEIKKISCDEFKARNYISIGSTVDYSNIHKILDVHESCKNMFKILPEEDL